jgi:hypothetical protein
MVGMVVIVTVILIVAREFMESMGGLEHTLQGNGVIHLQQLDGFGIQMKSVQEIEHF